MRMVMKMAAASTISLLLLCFSAISSTDSLEGCDYHVATGANFTVPINPVVDKLDRLKWLHNNKHILDRRNGKFLYGKKELIFENGSLSLANVNKNQEGDYIPQVHDQDGKSKGTFKVKRLCVIDPVQKPKVKHDCGKLSDVLFTCEVPGKGLTYAWLQQNAVLPKEKGSTLKRNTDQLTTDGISCKVSNQASDMTSDPVVHKCYNSFFPEKFLGVDTWIFVGAGGGVVLLLIIIVIVCCVRAKRRKRLHLKDEGELRLAWTNDQHQHQHQHQHHHHPHQQPAGHTGPRQQRSKQQRPRNPDQPNAHPQPSPRRPAQAPRPPGNVDEEQPPPLPQPRKNAGKAQRV